MSTLARLRSWCGAVLHRSRLEREIDDELRFHVDEYVNDLVRSGVPASEARRKARVEFGAIGARKDECREALGLRLFDEVTGDLRYACRQLRRSPAFATIAVLSLALGIGANTAIFSLMEAALWKTIPVTHPEQLRLLSWASGPNRVMSSINGDADQTAGGTTSTSFSYPVFVELQRQHEALSSVFGFKPIGRVTALVQGAPELLLAVLVSGNFYESVGVRPTAGRPIVAVDDTSAAAGPVALISDGFWSRRFGRDPAVIGKPLEVNSVPVTIIGVNPPEFTGVEPGQSPDLFMPLRLQPKVWERRGDLLNNPDYWWVLVMGRLRPAVSDAHAQAALDDTFTRAVQISLPKTASRDSPRLQMLRGARGLDQLSGRFNKPLLVLFLLVGVVLLIACANVANLLLARAASRQREISLRLALGAGRWRLARQLFTEGLALAFLGGVAGVLLGYWMRDSIPSLLATSWRPSPFRAEFNWRVLWLSVATTMATGILFSLAPAWTSTRAEISAGLKDAGRVMLTLPQWSRGKPLIVFQVGLSVVLLIGAGLFLRTLSNLASVGLGFKPERILLFTIDPPRGRYPGERRNQIFDQIQQRIGTLPGVELVTLSSSALVGGGSSGSGIVPDDKNSERHMVSVNEVGYDFFETMGIPILYGRSLNRLDGAASQLVAVVNQQFAREVFPNESPLGKTFRDGNRAFEIVGISGDSRYDKLRTAFPPTFYRPYLQEPPASLTDMAFEVKTRANEGSVISAIREAVRSIDKDLPVFDVRTQIEQIDATLSQERLFAALTSAFAALALVLACVGIYGIVANGVARRTNEIGIRIALGADRRRVLVMILREAGLLALIGGVIGAAAATGLTRYIQTMLFGVEPMDPATIAAAVLLMVFVALLAGWIPARRASRLEPMIALRHE